MASIDYIQKRIAGKEKEIVKLENKLARIRKVEAQGWEDPNPYFYDERDLRYCLKDLDNARAALKDWQEQLVSAEEKAQSRDVKVILNFLEGWKARVRKHYNDALPRYLKARQEWWDMEHTHSENYHKYAMRVITSEEWAEIDRDFHEYEKCYRSTWSFIVPYLKRTNGETVLDLDKLNKELNEEANRKYDFIIERTNAIVGQITDASALLIGAKGDLNGFILGTRGTAKVQTIGAGGYNIQCFHFRTLINPTR